MKIGGTFHVQFVVPLYNCNVSLLVIQFHAKTRITFNQFRLNFTGMRILADFPRGSFHIVRVKEFAPPRLERKDIEGLSGVTRSFLASYALESRNDAI